MLLLRDRAKFLSARRMAEMAAGVAKATSRTDFGLTTPTTVIVAGRSKNEFFEVP